MNVENAVAAVAALWCAARNEGRELDETRLRKALAGFAGVKRRFEFYVNTPRQVYMDDYAHHPRELAATLASVKRMFPGRRVTAIFQPHLYTRTRDFYREFAEALSHVDHLVLADIYAARETDTLGMSSEALAKETAKFGTDTHYFPSFEEIESFLKENCSSGDVVITMGAGDVVNVGEELLQSNA